MPDSIKVAIEIEYVPDGTKVPEFYDKLREGDYFATLAALSDIRHKCRKQDCFCHLSTIKMVPQS